MIFWWNESKLADFIEKTISKDSIQNDIDSLAGELKMMNNSVADEKRAVQELKVYVNKYMQEASRSSQSSIDIEHLVASIKADNIQFIRKTIEERNSSLELQIHESVRNTEKANRQLSVHENELQQLNDEIKKNTTNDLFAKLCKDYEDEKHKTAELKEIVQKQSKGIASLSQMVEELKIQVATLNSKLVGKETENRTEKDIPLQTKHLFFDNNANENKCRLMMLTEHAKQLKERLIQDGMALEDVYVKLTENMINKLKRLCDKNNEKKYDADKLANETAKILKQTIVKGMTQEKIKEFFLQYMNECGIRKLEWSVGRKMTNDDYEYLEEPIMYEEVSDEKMIGAITEIKQNTYVIDYYDDDEKYEAIIPGLYRIGKRKK